MLRRLLCSSGRLPHLVHKSSCATIGHQRFVKPSCRHHSRISRALRGSRRYWTCLASTEQPLIILRPDTSAFFLVRLSRTCC